MDMDMDMALRLTHLPSTRGIKMRSEGDKNGHGMEFEEDRNGI